FGASRYGLRLVEAVDRLGDCDSDPRDDRGSDAIVAGVDCGTTIWHFLHQRGFVIAGQTMFSRVLGWLFGISDVESVDGVSFSFAAPWAAEDVTWLIVGCLAAAGFAFWYYTRIQ